MKTPFFAYAFRRSFDCFKKQVCQLMRIVVKHKLPKSEAQVRINLLLINLKKKYHKNLSNLSEDWRNDKLELKAAINNLNTSALVTVSDSSINLDIRLPIAALLFKNRIRETIINELNMYLK